MGKQPRARISWNHSWHENNRSCAPLCLFMLFVSMFGGKQQERRWLSSSPPRMHVVLLWANRRRPPALKKGNMQFLCFTWAPTKGLVICFSLFLIPVGLGKDGILIPKFFLLLSLLGISTSMTINFRYWRSQIRHNFSFMMKTGLS